MTEQMEIPGYGPGAGLIVAKGDRIMLAEGDWHEIKSLAPELITCTDGLTLSPESVLAVKLPSER